VEKSDNASIDRKLGEAPLGTQWRADLLGGVMLITGKWANGSDLVAIPNYARMNRGGSPPDYPDDGDRRGPMSTVDSKVWI